MKASTAEEVPQLIYYKEHRTPGWAPPDQSDHLLIVPSYDKLFGLETLNYEASGVPECPTFLLCFTCATVGHFNWITIALLRQKNDNLITKRISSIRHWWLTLALTEDNKMLHWIISWLIHNCDCVHRSTEQFTNLNYGNICKTKWSDCHQCGATEKAVIDSTPLGEAMRLLFKKFRELFKSNHETANLYHFSSDHDQANVWNIFHLRCLYSVELYILSPPNVWIEPKSISLHFQLISVSYKTPVCRLAMHDTSTLRDSNHDVRDEHSWLSICTLQAHLIPPNNLLHSQWWRWNDHRLVLSPVLLFYSTCCFTESKKLGNVWTQRE